MSEAERESFRRELENADTTTFLEAAIEDWRAWLFTFAMAALIVLDGVLPSPWQYFAAGGACVGMGAAGVLTWVEVARMKRQRSADSPGAG